MTPNTRSIAAARRAEAALEQYKAAIDNLLAVTEDMDDFKIQSPQFQTLLRIGQSLCAHSVEADAIEDAVLDIAFEITEAAKAAA